MQIERHGAHRRHGTVTLANDPAALVLTDGINSVFLTVRGRRGVPDRGTTHRYTLAFSQSEILGALEALLEHSRHPKLAEPISLLLRELLASK